VLGRFLLIENLFNLENVECKILNVVPSFAPRNTISAFFMTVGWKERGYSEEQRYLCF